MAHQQSLEELSSIYSEASEFGLTSLGVTQPHQCQQEEEEEEEECEDGDMVVQQPAASIMAQEAVEGKDSKELEDYYSHQVECMTSCPGFCQSCVGVC